MTEGQAHTLQHALGLDRERREPWRNYYCAEDGTPALEALVVAGLMERRHTINDGQDRIYSVTPAGTAVALAALPEPYSPSQQRYRRYLGAADVWPDLTFREFLMAERKAPEQPPLFEGVEPKPLPPIPEEYAPYLTPRDDEEDYDE